MHLIPSAPICFRIWSGIWLKPELLFALNAFLIVYVSSAGVICSAPGVASGEYISSGSVSSWSMLLLCFANACGLRAEVSASFSFSIFQNYLGLYLSMSGIRICNCALFLTQHYLYSLYAYFAGVLDRPYVILCFLYCYFAFLHSSLYHGAMCFSHLLGFLLSVIVFLDITPNATASSIRNSSIFSALVSLSYAYFS